MAETEVYQGFRLDFTEIKGAVFEEKVVPFLATINDLCEQIYFLEILLNQHQLETGDIAQGYDERRHRSVTANLFDDEILDRIIARDKYKLRAGEFENRCKRRLDSLKQKFEIEARKPRTEQADEDQSEGVKSIKSSDLGEVTTLSIAQCVWAAHYLLTEAGMSYADVDKKEVARFIFALIGRGAGNIYPRVLNKDQRKKKDTQKDLGAVRAWFQRLGITRIVEKIDRERNIG